MHELLVFSLWNACCQLRIRGFATPYKYINGAGWLAYEVGQEKVLIGDSTIADFGMGEKKESEREEDLPFQHLKDWRGFVFSPYISKLITNLAKCEISLDTFDKDRNQVAVTPSSLCKIS